MRSRIPSETKRRRCVTLTGKDLDVIESCIGQGAFSQWIRQQLRQSYPSQYWSKQGDKGTQMGCTQ